MTYSTPTEEGIRTAPPPGFHRYTELEKQTSTIHKFEALLISGLFQTEDYARAVMGSIYPPNSIEPALAARMARKASVLDREVPPRVWLILDEWVLRRRIGGAEVMHEQLRFLLEACDNPHNTIQILPADTRHYVAYSGSFTVLGFDDSPGVAYIEAAGQAMLTPEPQAVADCVIRYDLLQGHAYNVDESRKLVETVMESYENA